VHLLFKSLPLNVEDCEQLLNDSRLNLHVLQSHVNGIGGKCSSFFNKYAKFSYLATRCI